MGVVVHYVTVSPGQTPADCALKLQIILIKFMILISNISMFIYSDTIILHKLMAFCCSI